MGIILIPVLFITAAAWILNLVFLFIRISRRQMYSWKWSLAISPFFAAGVFVLYWLSWQDAGRFGY